jgi:hypothetical protein
MAERLPLGLSGGGQTIAANNPIPVAGRIAMI